MHKKISRTIIFIICSFILFTSINNSEVLAQQDLKGTRTIYLIRHGDYAPQDDNIPDSENVLTPLGIAQVRLVSTRLKAMSINFNSLISSTMIRAKQTAEVINKDFQDLVLEQSDLIRECTPPTWREDVMAETNAAEVEECVNNLEQAFQKYFIPSPDEKDRNDIIVCHGNVIRYFVTKVLKVDTMSWLQMSISNCSLTIIRILPDGNMKLDAFSDYGHIPENMRTFTGGKNKEKELIIDANKK
jgi:serine/threonine-protein phosphatase PGAM5